MTAMLAGCSGGALSPATSPVLNPASVLRSASGAGSLDRSFGKDGKVIVSLDMAPVAAAIATGGRILVTGYLGQTYGQIAVVRLLPNGTLDSSFGSGGIVKVSMSALSSLTPLRRGKVLLGGVDPSGTHAELVQLSASGELDSSFGTDGIVQFDYVANSSNEVLAVVTSKDGDIIAGGFGLATNSDDYLTSLARFDANGNADQSFGTNGIVTLDLVGGVTALGLQSDGKILVCGGFISPKTDLVVRFLKNGKLDRTDTGGSLVSVAHTGSSTFEGTNEFQLDGKLLQWENLPNKSSGRHYIRVVRKLRDYSRDPSFKSVRFAFASPDYGEAKDVEIAPDGKLVVGGEGDRHGAEVVGLARLTEGGPLDDAFGRHGRVVTKVEPDSSAEFTALAVQSDGKVVGAGAVSTGGSSASLAVVRYLGD